MTRHSVPPTQPKRREGFKPSLRRHILSHRLRGFGFPDGSIEALQEAARAGVTHVEIDTRATADGDLLVHHDAYLGSIATGTGLIRDLKTRHRQTPLFLGSQIRVPRLADFAKVFARLNQDITLYLDIKDVGFENEHLSILSKNHLLERTHIISWWPEVLVRVHKLDPLIPLCFSHISLAAITGGRNRLARLIATGIAQLAGSVATHVEALQGHTQLLVSIDDANRRINGKVLGTPVHVLTSLPDGLIGKALKRSQGSLGIPSALLNKGFVTQAHRAGFRVFAFTLNDERTLKEAITDCHADMVFTDRSDLIRVSR